MANQARIYLFLSEIYFFFQAEEGIRDADVTGVQTCALPILMKAMPWSSWGTSPEGIAFIRKTVPPSMAANSSTPTTACRSSQSTTAEKLAVSLSKPASNQRNTVSCLPSWPSNRAHMAGVRVSATIPEITTDTAIVIANCRYSSPLRPPSKATGANTATSTRVDDTTAPETWPMVATAAL